MLFYKKDERMMLINFLLQGKYDDNSRIIFEYKKTQEKYTKYKIYWAFYNFNDFYIEGLIKIRYLKAL